MLGLLLLVPVPPSPYVLPLLMLLPVPVPPSPCLVPLLLLLLLLLVPLSTCLVPLRLLLLACPPPLPRGSPSPLSLRRLCVPASTPLASVSLSPLMRLCRASSEYVAAPPSCATSPSTPRDCRGRDRASCRSSVTEWTRSSAESVPAAGRADADECEVPEKAVRHRLPGTSGAGAALPYPTAATPRLCGAGAAPPALSCAPPALSCAACCARSCASAGPTTGASSAVPTESAQGALRLTGHSHSRVAIPARPLGARTPPRRPHAYTCTVSGRPPARNVKQERKKCRSDPARWHLPWGGGGAGARRVREDWLRR